MTLVYSHGEMLMALDSEVIEDVMERLPLRDGPFVD